MSAQPDGRGSRDAHVLALPAWLGLFALAFGVFRIAHPGFWCDEIYTVRWTRLPIPELIAALRTDLHPPLFFLLERAFVRMLGESERSARLLPLLAGAASVAASGWAFRPALRERRALGVAVVLAISPQFFLYAGMARYYSLAALVVLLAHGCFERLSREPERAAPRIAYALAVAAVLYTSYLAACVVVAHGLVAFATRRSRPASLRAWSIGAGIGALAFLPWVPVLLAQLRVAHAVSPAIASGARAPLAMLAYEALSFTATELQGPWTWAGALGLVAGAVLLVRGLVVAWRDAETRVSDLTGVLSLSLAIGVTALFARGTPFVSVPARTLFLWPFVALVLAAGLRAAPSRVFGAVCVALLVAWAAGWYHLGAARDWLNPIYLTPGREVATDVRAQVKPGDLVLAEDDTGVPYYLERDRCPVPVVDPVRRDATGMLAGREVRRAWVARLERDGSEAVRPSAPLDSALAGWGSPSFARGYLEYSSGFRSARRLAGLANHRHRVRLELWTRRESVPATR